MTNEEYWRAYEKETGKKRPPYIDGVGNVNYHFYTGQRPKPKPPAVTPQQSAAMMPRVQARPLDLAAFMPQAEQARPWQVGLRGWMPG